jgi:hypothetical protein
MVEIGINQNFLSPSLKSNNLLSSHSNWKLKNNENEVLDQRN